MTAAKTELLPEEVESKDDVEQKQLHTEDHHVICFQWGELVSEHPAFWHPAKIAFRKPLFKG